MFMKLLEECFLVSNMTKIRCLEEKAIYIFYQAFIFYQNEYAGISKNFIKN